MMKSEYHKELLNAMFSSGITALESEVADAIIYLESNGYTIAKKVNIGKDFIIDAVKSALENNCCDGLCNDGCGCGLDDFMPCGEPSIETCVPAKKVVNAKCYECEVVDCFLVGTSKVTTCFKRAK